MPEPERYGGDIEGVEHGVQGTEYGGQQHRGEDLASTYVLCPCWRTRLSSIWRRQAGETQGNYIVRGENNRKKQGTKEKTK